GAIRLIVILQASHSSLFYRRRLSLSLDARRRTLRPRSFSFRSSHTALLLDHENHFHAGF
ncbi:MAG: hypothetical protein EBS82_07085, partial [Methylocystaceae bacterium]|nr:hypothetical protein [Methylocystaceae bacterium]